MTRDELIRHIQEAVKTEESAVTVYSRHLAAIVTKSGLPEQTVLRVKETLQYLIHANEEHKAVLESLAEEIRGEAVDVF